VIKRQRPGVLAVRAVNQYRRRDVLTYLALRYYLDNDAARTDQWTREVATDLVLSRSEPVYFQALHFKDVSHQKTIDHRHMLLPGANEALAEAALLAECAKHPQAFGNPACVFSYPLNSGDDRSGIYENYSKGLRRRHDAIAKACDEIPDGVVQYIDLKKFYPSISIRYTTSGISGTSTTSPWLEQKNMSLRYCGKYAISCRCSWASRS
jgi:hypothetical protein